MLIALKRGRRARGWKRRACWEGSRKTHKDGVGEAGRAGDGGVEGRRLAEVEVGGLVSLLPDVNRSEVP